MSSVNHPLEQERMAAIVVHPLYLNINLAFGQIHLSTLDKILDLDYMSKKHLRLQLILLFSRQMLLGIETVKAGKFHDINGADSTTYWSGTNID